MVNIFVLIIFLVTAVNTLDYSNPEVLPKCVKALKKFTMTRICAQQKLAIECLNIETAYVTGVLDYCYKELNFDPINLDSTLQYICSYEETIEESAECLCRAADRVQEPNVTEDIEYEISENEDFERPFSYKTSMLDCLHYMDSIYHKRKFW